MRLGLHYANFPGASITTGGLFFCQGSGGRTIPARRLFQLSRLPPFVCAAVPLGCRLLFFPSDEPMIPPSNAQVNPFSIFLRLLQIKHRIMCNINNNLFPGSHHTEGRRTAQRKASQRRPERRQSVYMPLHSQEDTAEAEESNTGQSRPVSEGNRIGRHHDASPCRLSPL